MSRNLGQTNCNFCRGVVKLDEPPREVTKDDVGEYYETRDGYGHAGMIAAKASCVDCGAKYLAHISMAKCVGYSWPQLRGEGEFFDLSFRESFNDEPGEKDLPDFEITDSPATPEECALLGAHSAVVRRRAPWPRCPDTGLKIWWGYGCTCMQPERWRCKHDAETA
jgi:hypothetical protein